MPANVAKLGEAVIGRRIVSAEKGEVAREYYGLSDGRILTLDYGTKVSLVDTADCCAYTDAGGVPPAPRDGRSRDPWGGHNGRLHEVAHLRRPRRRAGASTSAGRAGNPFYYGYGFDIAVQPLSEVG